MKRREPSIQNLVKRYNEACAQMRILLQRGQAPVGATVPLDINGKTVFLLDVDDNIWQDIGLDDSTDGLAIPLWLGNEDVRCGIRAQLELDRCNEEEARLKRERCAMQEWFLEEWNATIAARTQATGGTSLAIMRCVLHSLNTSSASNIDLVYQLDRYLKRLQILCVAWKSKTAMITPAYPMPSSWGPSDQELQETAFAEFHGRWDESASCEDDDDSVDGDEEDGPDEDETALVEDLEQLALADTFHLDLEDDLDSSATSSSHTFASQVEYSSRKRMHFLIDE